MATTAYLPNAYRGDGYAFRLTFPDASFLAGSPDDVLAQIRVRPADTVIAATWDVAVDGASLVLSIAEMTLDPGVYFTDVQVGATTYLKATRLIVDGDVSREVGP